VTYSEARDDVTLTKRQKREDVLKLGDSKDNIIKLF
jgi:hypothetical protein